MKKFSKCFDMNVTENKINQSVCDAVKTVRGNLRVIVIKRKDPKSLSHLPKVEKEIQTKHIANRRKKIIKIKK